MTEGLFGSFGLDESQVATAADPTGLPAGNYPGIIAEVRKEEGIRKDNLPWLSMVIKYDLTLKDGSTTSKEEWFFMPTKPQSEWDFQTPLRNKQGDVMVDRTTRQPLTEGSTNLQNLGRIKRRLLSIGVPADKLNKVDPFAGHLDGIPVVVKIVLNRRTGYTEVSNTSDGVKPAPTGNLSMPTPPPAVAPQVSQVFAPPAFGTPSFG